MVICNDGADTQHVIRVALNFYNCRWF